MDLLGLLPPALRALVVAARLGQLHAPVERHPAQDLRGRELLGLAAHLPDAAVGLLPGGRRVIHQRGDHVPSRLGGLLSESARVRLHRIEQHAPDVVLLLVPGAVPDPDRAGTLVAGQVVQSALLELPLAADPVHDLKRPRRDRLEQEREELVGLPLEAQREQAAQHEGRVAYPGVAVVPVALATRCLGQGGRPGRENGSRGRVAQTLQRERAPLEVGAPGVVGEAPALQPIAPEPGRAPRALVGLLQGHGPGAVAP